VYETAPAAHRPLRWRYVVLDEAHRIKNETTLVGKAVRYLKASGKLLLTGKSLASTDCVTS
jgi:SWI/SNF-related matrix-associated actin-dependent regulator of chromatin subfamily A member 5